MNTHDATVQAIIRAIEQRGYAVTLDMPGEGFHLLYPAGEFVDQLAAADESVNNLAMLLEVLTTDQGFECEGSPEQIAARLLTFCDPVAALQMEYEGDLKALTEILSAVPAAS